MRPYAQTHTHIKIDYKTYAHIMNMIVHKSIRKYSTD